MNNYSILVIGDMMLDKYFTGAVTRISPEAPVPVVSVRSEFSTLGGALNVVNNIHSLGSKVQALGFIGNDSNGDLVRKNLEEAGISSLLISTDKIPTTTKTRVVGDRQQITRLDFEGYFDYCDNDFENLINKVEITSRNIVVISDYSKGVCSEALCKKISELCLSFDVPLIIDPKGKDWGKYSNAFLITPNLKELQDVFGSNIKNDDIDIFNSSILLMDKYNISNLLVTRSEKGMSLISKDGFCKHVSTEAKDVFDVCGAGDTVVAVVAHCLSKGMSLLTSVELANRAAGIVVGKFGTYAITKEEFELL